MPAIYCQRHTACQLCQYSALPCCACHVVPATLHLATLCLPQCAGHIAPATICLPPCAVQALLMSLCPASSHHSFIVLAHQCHKPHHAFHDKQCLAALCPRTVGMLMMLATKSNELFAGLTDTAVSVYLGTLTAIWLFCKPYFALLVCKAVCIANRMRIWRACGSSWLRASRQQKPYGVQVSRPGLRLRSMVSVLGEPRHSTKS